MQVVGIDNPTVDFLVHVDKLPETNKGTKLVEYGWQGGGKVATALVTLGRLGVESGMIGVVGDDDFGLFCKKDFEMHSVDTSCLVVDQGATTTFCVCVSERETLGRNIIGRGGTRRELNLDDIQEDYIARARYLHLTYMDEIIKQAAVMARKHGVKVVFDADWYHQEADDNIYLIDVFIASEFYYKAMFQDDNFEENCRAVQKRGPGTVIFTFGEKGCVGMDGEEFFKVPSFQVEAVDTTGAGDVFHGAFIYGLLNGWEAKKTARFASAVSAIKCTRVGGRAGIPDLKTVKKF